MKKILSIFALAFLLISCKKEVKLSAESIVNKTIEIAGGEKYSNFELEFDFRNKHYKTIVDNDNYQYERQFNDTLGAVKDVLNNVGFQRFIDDDLIKVADSMAIKYSSSVNSVHYFVLLPNGLNAEAVNKEYLGIETINDNDYHKIRVTFNQEGGGEDFEDVFIYWIGINSFKIDYLAYSYIEDDGVGLRFRTAYNERYVNGLRFVDYNNYKPKDPKVNLPDLGQLFETDKLQLLSKIEIENISVK